MNKKLFAVFSQDLKTRYSSAILLAFNGAIAGEVCDLITKQYPDGKFYVAAVPLNSVKMFDELYETEINRFMMKE